MLGNPTQCIKLSLNTKLPSLAQSSMLLRLRRAQMFCCTALWLVTLNGPEPESVVQLSEAAVGGRVPLRLAQ